MGLFDFLFSSGISNSQKKAHRNAGNNTSSDHENYARGYEVTVSANRYHCSA